MEGRCQHGFFVAQFQHVPCPWCYGVDARNADVVPPRGRGNGWLLRRGQATCPDCGGPGGGEGLLPPYMTHEYFKQVIAPQNRLCRDCAKSRFDRGLPIPRPAGMEEAEVPLAVRQEAARRMAESDAKAEAVRAQLPDPYTGEVWQSEELGGPGERF